ncbi:MFS family permease [Bradyrhizobium sp. GM7.3]
MRVSTARYEAFEAGVPHSGSRLATSLTLAAMSLGYGVVQLDVTIVNTALDAMGKTLGGGVAELQWVVSAYTIAFAAFILTAGALGDRIGAKRVFMAGFAIFTAASLACALSPNATVLIGARLVQGLAAAILVPNSLALLNHAYPDDRERGRAVAIWAAGASLALTAGPFVGGALITLVGWRAIFLVNLPIGLIGLWLSWRYATETTRAPSREIIDLPGQLAAIGALGALAGAIIEGGALGWQHPAVLAAFASAALLAVLFVWRESRATQPMLPLSLFDHRLFSLTALVGLLVNVAIYGLIFVLSLYFQRINGLSGVVDRSRLRADDGGGAAGQSAGPAPRRAYRPVPDHRRRSLRLGARLSRPAVDRGRYKLLGDLCADDRDQQRTWAAGAAADLDLAGQRREGTLRHRGGRPERDAADRQRARRCAVRFAGGLGRRVCDRPAPVAGRVGGRAAARRRRDRPRRAFARMNNPSD